MKQLKLTKEGMRQLEEILEEKKEALRKLRKERAEFLGSGKDASYSNFAISQTELRERILLNEISELEKYKKAAKIVTEESKENVANIGSKVTIIIEDTLEDDREECTVTLTGDFGDTDKGRVSVKSPMGSCIMGQKQGFKGTYNVNGYELEVTIVRIEN